MLKLLQRAKNKKGFTLIELIVVIAILAILAAILVPSMIGIVSSSKDTVRLANTRSIYSAAQSAYVSVSLIDNETIDTSKTYDSTVSADAATPFMVAIKENLGNDFVGSYVITLNNNGVVKVVYTDKDGNTCTYPSESSVPSSSQG